MNRAIILFSLLLTFVLTSQAQRPSLPTALHNTTIDSQFYYIQILSKSQGGFKLIRPTNVEIVRSSVRDTLSKLNKEIVEIKSENELQKNQLTSSQDSITTLSSALSKEKERVDNISFLGINFSKGSYHTFVWTIIIALALAVTFLLSSFKRAKSTSTEEKKHREEIEEEMQQLRKKSLEKEQKLKRQLLDEQLKRNG
ncbi:MAG TPA: hypothetical protein H9853_05710 [Candidatus Sphingobacterium stercoripullorum]|uniref:tRNA (Guanine-N1)-methyltransferase n=1 Tax=Candidatus Sphingobacterium stercoripullorum TaxID=2838759 RepID=A0A9D2AZ39_9SPHI|nr:hypothetical protein [Candidatus Sphingobacterium stercoripullorum]